MKSYSEPCAHCGTSCIGTYRFSAALGETIEVDRPTFNSILDRALAISPYQELPEIVRSYNECRGAFKGEGGPLDAGDLLQLLGVLASLPEGGTFELDRVRAFLEALHDLATEAMASHDPIALEDA